MGVSVSLDESIATQVTLSNVGTVRLADDPAVKGK